MSLHQPTHTVISFGPFEANLQTQELTRQGVPLRLPRQSFQILTMLLQTPGELIPRDELRLTLWPSDTFVDFEKGINAAINRLRETLGDSAENPRYVETLPRRGYRFIAPVDKRNAVIQEPEHPPTPERAPRLTGNKRLALLASFLCLLVLAVLFIWLKLRSSSPGHVAHSTVALQNQTYPRQSICFRVGLGFGFTFTEVEPMNRQSSVVCLIHRRSSLSPRNAFRMHRPK